jgi:hypothetical protein
MSIQVETAFVKQYSSTLSHLVQQKGSRLRATVRVEPLVGREGYFDQIGATEAQQRTTRHGQSPIVSTPHARRRVSGADFEWGDLVDGQDKVRMLIDPASSYLQSATYALGRKIDDVIIAAASGTAFTGETGTLAVALPAGQKVAVAATGLTIDKLIKAKEILDANEVDPDEDRYLVCAAKQVTNQLGTTQVTSSDYNTDKALVQGQIDTFLGFHFVRSERLPKDGSNNRLALAYSKSAILLALNKDINGQMSPRPDKSFAMYVYACLIAGATRMEETRVVEIACQET